MLDVVGLTDRLEARPVGAVAGRFVVLAPGTRETHIGIALALQKDA